MSKHVVKPNGVVILHPARMQEFSVGRKVHDVDDDILAAAAPSMRAELFNYCGQNFEAIFIRSNGEGAHIPATDWQREVEPERRAWLRDLAVSVNVRASGPGMWVLAWDNANDRHPRVWTMLWFDPDGDLQLEAKETDLSFRRATKAGIDRYVEGAARCIDEWANRLLEVELNDNQMIKHAQGERR